LRITVSSHLRRGGRATPERAANRLLWGAEAAVDFPRQGSQINSMKYRVVIAPDEDGLFVAECPAMPGCISQGKTRAEALANIKDAMTGYLASLKKHGEPVPPPISEEIVEILA
jgi:antitoxin HicB